MAKKLDRDHIWDQIWEPVWEKAFSVIFDEIWEPLDGQIGYEIHRVYNALWEPGHLGSPGRLVEQEMIKKERY